MQQSVRSYLTAGAALATAGALVVSPINPVSLQAQDAAVSVMRVSDQAVALTAAVDPLNRYVEVFQTASANVQNLIDQVSANPTPLLDAVLANQQTNWGNLATALQTALDIATANAETVVPKAQKKISDALAAGDVETALNAMLTLPMDLIAGKGGTGGVIGVASVLKPVMLALRDIGLNPLKNTEAAINAVVGTSVSTAGMGPLMALAGVIGPVMSGIGSVGTAVQDVLDPVMDGDVASAFGAALQAPATVIDGVLNGGYGPELNALIKKFKFPGVVSGNTSLPMGFGNLGGTFQSLINVRDTVVKAIAPKTTATATAATLAAPATLPAAESAAPTNDVASVPALTAAPKDVNVVTVDLTDAAAADIPEVAADTAKAAAQPATEPAQPTGADSVVTTNSASTTATESAPAATSTPAESTATEPAGEAMSADKAADKAAEKAESKPETKREAKRETKRETKKVHKAGPRHAKKDSAGKSESKGSDN